MCDGVCVFVSSPIRSLSASLPGLIFGRTGVTPANIPTSALPLGGKPLFARILRYLQKSMYNKHKVFTVTNSALLLQALVRLEASMPMSSATFCLALVFCAAGQRTVSETNKT